MKEKFGLSEFWFIDPNYIGSKKIGSRRANNLAKKIIEKKLNITYSIECRADDVVNNADLFELMFESGLRRVFLGIESGIQEKLDLFNKNTTVENNINAIKILKKIGFSVHISIIYYEPLTTIEDLKQNLYFIRTLGLDVSYPGIGRNCLGLLPGTKLTEKFKEDFNLEVEGQGLTYKFLCQDIELFRYLILNYLKNNPVIKKCERIIWRDQFIMSNNFQLHGKIKTLNFLKNSLVVCLMEHLVEYFERVKNKNTKALAESYSQIFDKQKNSYKSLVNIFEEIKTAL